MNRFYSILGLALLLVGMSAIDLSAAEGKRGKGYGKRHPEIMKRIAEGAIDLLFLGDSITEGWTGPGKTTWEKFAAYKPANFGISSEETKHLLYRVTSDELVGFEAKVVVLMIGVNDISHKAGNAQTISAGIKKILDVIREKQPKAKVVLMSLMPFGKEAESKNRKTVVEVNAQVKTWADGKNVFYVNVHDKMLNDKGTVIEGAMDGASLHPTDKGYEIWHAVLVPVIEPLLK